MTHKKRLPPLVPKATKVVHIASSPALSTSLDDANGRRHTMISDISTPLQQEAVKAKAARFRKAASNRQTNHGGMNHDRIVFNSNQHNNRMPLSFDKQVTLPTITEVPSNNRSLQPFELEPSLYGRYPPIRPSSIPRFRERVNPTWPPPPRWPHVQLETIEPHWMNELRADDMKRWQHERYHKAYRRYYYGSEVELAEHKSFIREVLKQQMMEKEFSRRNALTRRMTDSVEAIEKDRRSGLEELEAIRLRNDYLKNFRDENKNMMELSWSERTRRKRELDLYELSLQKHDPFNWSKTLT